METWNTAPPSLWSFYLKPNGEESSASEESDSEFEDIPEYDTDSTDEEEQAADSIANVGFVTRVGRQVKTPKRFLG